MFDWFWDALRGAIRGFLQTIQDNIGWVTSNDQFYAPLQSALPGVYAFAKAVQAGVTGPLGYSILGFCVLVSIYEALTKNQELSSGTKTFELIIVSLLSFIILKVVVDHAALIMEFTFAVFNNVTTGIAKVEPPDSSGYTMADSAWVDTVMESVKGNELAFFVPAMLAAFLTMVATAAATVILLMRFIELYVYLALAPIPLATLASPHSSDIGKGFLKNFVACVLQASVIVLVLRFFPLVLGSIQPGVGLWGVFVPPIIYSVVLLVSLVGASGLARKALGI